jgi:SAM-dependent MidA family methyltransferase
LKAEHSETFERFMERALHDPARGYYARNIRNIGARGDFTTAPQLSETPAKAIAAWVARALRETKTRNLIEVGPGLGTLSRQVIRNLPLHLRLRTGFHLVESSPTLANHQKELFGKKVRHHTTVLDALEACSGEAVIFSNELVDAFPVRLFKKTENSWREVALDHTKGYAVETLLPPATLPPSSVFSGDYATGQTVEVHDSYRRWLESWLPFWKKGKMLTIDYGDTAEKLYVRRPHGTLRAYLLHQRLEGSAIYGNPGLQDITADVNFTDLAEWALSWLDSSPVSNFAEFLRPFAKPSEALFLESAEHFRTLIQEPRGSVASQA